MSNVVMPTVQASGSIFTYRPGGCITAGTARKSEEDYLIAPKDMTNAVVRQRNMTNTFPSRQQATGLNINPLDLCPPIIFIYF